MWYYYGGLKPIGLGHPSVLLWLEKPWCLFICFLPLSPKMLNSDEQCPVGSSQGPASCTDEMRL